VGDLTARRYAGMARVSEESRSFTCYTHVVDGNDDKWDSVSYVIDVPNQTTHALPAGFTLSVTMNTRAQQ